MRLGMTFVPKHLNINEMGNPNTHYAIFSGTDLETHLLKLYMSSMFLALPT